MTLMPHQVGAIEGGPGGPGVIALLRLRDKDGVKLHRRLLVIAATGTGKTNIFMELARRAHAKTGKPSLFVVHRKGLMEQGAEAGREFGLVVGYEHGKRSGIDMIEPPQLVVSTVQTMATRLERYGKDHFASVFIDEAHFALGSDHRAIVDYFDCPTIGATATPDRGDGLKLSEVFTEVAYCYDIPNGQADGWLVPIVAEPVLIPQMELDRIASRGGDLAADELSEEIQRAAVLNAIASALVDKAGRRPTIVFTPDVASAHAMAVAIRKYTTAGALAGDGGMSEDELAAVLREFDEGRCQFLVCCEIWSTGFDRRKIACVAMARPTTARSFYTQCVGRGTRVDPADRAAFYTAATAQERKWLIAQSAKRDVLVLDFYGNTTRHSLACPLDTLGERLPPELRVLAFKEMDGKKTIEEAVAEARKKLAAEVERMAAVNDLQYRTMRVNAFDPIKALGSKAKGDPRGEVSTSGQCAALKKFGVKRPEDYSKKEAGRLLKTLSERAKAGLCALWQFEELEKAGVPTETLRDMTFEEASTLLTEYRRNKQQRPRRWLLEPRLIS